MKTRKPAWWQLFLLVPVMLGLVGLEALKPLPGVSDQIVDAAVVVLFFGSVLEWVHMNGGLLETYSMEQDGACDFKVTVYSPQRSQAACPEEVANYEVPQPDWKDVVLTKEEKWSRN